MISMRTLHRSAHKEARMDQKTRVAGKIEVLPYDESIPLPYKATGRRHKPKKLGGENQQVVVPYPARDLMLRAYLNVQSGETLEQVVSIAMATDFDDFLLKLEKSGQDPVGAERTLRSIVPENVYSDDGPYVQERDLRGNPINLKELQAMNRNLHFFLDRFGDTPMWKFNDVTFIRSMVKDLRMNGRRGKKKTFSEYSGKQLSSSTVKNILLAVSWVFSYLIDIGETDFNPIPMAMRMLPGKSASRSFQPLPHEVIVMMFSNPAIWTDYPSFAMNVFLNGTAARISEGEALQVKHIDLKNRVIRIEQALKKGGEIGETKTRSTREIPMSALVVKALCPLLVGKSDEDFVFSLDGKKPYTRIKYSRALIKALCAVGISEEVQQKSGYVLHSYRHGFISWAVAKNISDANISLITGHDTARLSTMNLRYTAQLREAYPAIIAAIDSFFTPEETEAIEKALDTLCPRWWRKEVKR